MVNNAPLVVFRVLFGLLMALESFGAIATGWVFRAYVEPKLTFPVFTIGWPQPLPGYGMYGWFIVMGLAALATMAGWRYRFSSVVLATLWTGAYLTQKTHYNNHYYLAVLICWAMVFLPAHRRAALDVRRRRVAWASRTVEWTDRCPGWIVRAFQLQVGIVFVYAAIAKLYPGWLGGQYLGYMFGHKASLPVLGPLLAQPWFQTFIAYSGIAFDALVIPMLMWSRTRLLALVGLLIFNLFNSAVFHIGVFPYLVLALTVFFFEPETIERRFAWLFRREPSRRGEAPPHSGAPAPWLRVVLVVYFALQLALPLRHHLLPGDVNWTEEGHRLSWRMMMHAKAGRLILVAKDPDSGRAWTIDQQAWLTRKQRRRVATKPDMLYQFIQALKAHYAAQGMPNVELYARRSAVSLNGGPPAPLYDPRVDLARVSYDAFGRDAWVLDRAPP